MHDEKCEAPIVFPFWTRIKESRKKETVGSVGALKKKKERKIAIYLIPMLLNKWIEIVHRCKILELSGCIMYDSTIRMTRDIEISYKYRFSVKVQAGTHIVSVVYRERHEYQWYWFFFNFNHAKLLRLRKEKDFYSEYWKRLISIEILYNFLCSSATFQKYRGRMKRIIRLI